MEKVTVSLDNILSGLLLKFGKANVLDINVVKKDLITRYGVIVNHFDVKGLSISDYIVFSGDNYYPIDDEKTKIVLENTQGEFLKEYFEKLCIEDLVLSKIHMCEKVPEHNFGIVFSEKQEEVIPKLVEEFDAIYVWNDDVVYDDYRELQLTTRGEVRVFELQYSQQVEEFKKLLISSGYDANLVYDFLKTQKLDQSIYDILNLDNFLLYCIEFDRASSLNDDNIVKHVKKN